MTETFIQPSEIINIIFQKEKKRFIRTVDSVLRAARAKLFAVLRAAWMALELSVAEGGTAGGTELSTSVVVVVVVTSICKIKQ